MLFNSIDFAVFFPIFFLLYWIVAKNLRLRNALILSSSYLFYRWWDWRFLFLIITSSLVDYIVGNKIYHLKNKAKTNGSKVLVISSPDLRVSFKKNNYFSSELEPLLEKNDTPFLNLNDHYQEMGIEVKDLRDPGHLNINDANKASVF